MKNMFRVLFLLLFLFITTSPSIALDIVLPKEKKMDVTTNYAFFVGKASKYDTVTINDEKVFVAPNGAFAYSVKLKDGENRIVVKSGSNSSFYKIYKKDAEKIIEPQLVELDKRKFTVKKDNTPLRSTPEDYGMNRMSHLFEGTDILINGEKGDFYRVYLSKDKVGWISKSSVEESQNTEVPKFLTINSKTFKNASVHNIEFTGKIPYTIDETEDEIIFKVYNPEFSDNSVYTVTVKRPEKYSYKTILADRGSYVFKVTKLKETNKKTLEGYNITVDAGHGGSENGAIGCLGQKEKSINLLIARELYDILSQMGACVFMTRELDANVSLDDRIKIARDNCSDIFISIHLNSISDINFDVHKNRGTTVYYYNRNSKELAKSIEKSLTNTLDTRKNGIRTASFAVIRPTDYIGVLVENAYMTNPLDSVLYNSKDFPRNAAKGIVEGILNYVFCEK